MQTILNGRISFSVVNYYRTKFVRSIYVKMLTLGNSVRLESWLRTHMEAAHQPLQMKSSGMVQYRGFNYRI